MGKNQSVKNGVSEIVADDEKGGTNDKTTFEVGTDIANVASELIDSMSSVNEHAIAHEQLIHDEKMAQYADLIDKNGNSFDPSIHKTTASGEPKLTASGKLSLRPGRKKEDGPKIVSRVGGLNTDKTIEQKPTPQAEARATGKAAANILITLAVQFGGDEFYPVKNEQAGVDEKVLLENSFADYFEATGRTDFPPGVALTIAVSGYILPRFTMPKTKTKMQRFKLWVGSKVAAHRLRKQAAEGKQHAEMAA